MSFCHTTNFDTTDVLNEGPVVDGTFVPELPGVSLLRGRFDSSINVMVGHNGDEGFGFPSLLNNTAFSSKQGSLPIHPHNLT